MEYPKTWKGKLRVTRKDEVFWNKERIGSITKIENCWYPFDQEERLMTRTLSKHGAIYRVVRKHLGNHA